MISKKMYRFLKKLPRWPLNKSFDKIITESKRDKFTRLDLLVDAKSKGLVDCNGKEDKGTSGYYLTENGQEAIEAYKRELGASQKATWALVIAGLSFVVSIIAFFC